MWVLYVASGIKKTGIAKVYGKVSKEMKSSYTIMHLGGSLVVPHLSDEGGIDVTFLKRFVRFLKYELKKRRKFVIVVGGGKATRVYQKSAAKITKITNHDLDWIGIHSTRLNAHLLRTIFAKEAYPVVIDHNPFQEEVESMKASKRLIFFASGWRPGWSTDYIAVRLAEKFNSKEVIIAKDTPYVYDSDPRKNSKAQPIKKITWKEYKKLIPSEWSPGLSSPVDPVAAKLAEQMGLKAKILSGKNLVSLKAAVEGKQFRGTLIHS